MNHTSFTLRGTIVDVVSRRIFQGSVNVINGTIAGIREEQVEERQVILPGLVDAHIHIESSMLIPSEFARLAVVHGTVATVSDPHEIANVLGIPGVHFMIDNGKRVPFKFHFGASSCVPATGFETSGATFSADTLATLLEHPEIGYLSEMMNFPGVLFRDPEVMAKLEVAKKAGKPIDGHAPGLRGEEARTYIEAGISTDHECFSLEEALDKLSYGMHIQIREGSAARNFDALHSLLSTHPDRVMLCSDDKHPDDLVRGHINELIIRAIKLGHPLMNVLRSCTANPVKHYRLPVGLLQVGDPADMIVVEDLDRFRVLQTYVNGMLVASEGKSLLGSLTEKPVNQFETSPISPEQLAVPVAGRLIRVQQALDGQLITGELEMEPLIRNDLVISDSQRDILKFVVKSRYANTPPAIGFIHGFGLKTGAIASCVAHDSHNIVAVGTDDAALAAAINLIVESHGGISLTGPGGSTVLPLPVAGIMTTGDGYAVAKLYESIDQQAKAMGSTLRAPYMTLSFMALLVIPKLKLSDKGLFDGEKFAFVPLFC